MIFSLNFRSQAATSLEHLAGGFPRFSALAFLAVGCLGGAKLETAQAQNTPMVAQPGLSASYFAGTTPGAAPLSQAIVPAALFNWRYGSCDAAVPADGWSARFEGLIEAPCTGTVRFATLSDDGVRLWVNGRRIINNWTQHSETLNSGTIQMVKGQKVPFKCEYFDAVGGARLELMWNYPEKRATSFRRRPTGISLRRHFPSPQLLPRLFFARSPRTN